jgi:hypothetical protein
MLSAFRPVAGRCRAWSRINRQRRSPSHISCTCSRQRRAHYRRGRQQQQQRGARETSDIRRGPAFRGGTNQSDLGKHLQFLYLSIAKCLDSRGDTTYMARAEMWPKANPTKTPKQWIWGAADGLRGNQKPNEYSVRNVCCMPTETRRGQSSRQPHPRYHLQ